MSIENHQSDETKEKRSHWVPLRNGGFGADISQRFENISWEPNKIPHGKELEINILGLLYLMNNYDIRREIIISNLQNKDRSRTSAPQMGNHRGETVLTNVSTPTKEPEPGETSISRSGTINIKINFDGLYQYLDENISDGRNNSQFPKLYGNSVDRALKRQFAPAINKNFTYKLKNDEDIPMGIECILLGAVGFTGAIGSLIGISFLLAQGNGHLIPGRLSTGLTSMYEVYVLSQAIPLLTLKYLEWKSKKEKREPSKFVKEILEIYEKNGLLSSVLYPNRLTHTLFGPQLRNLVLKKDPLIRGRGTA